MTSSAPTHVIHVTVAPVAEDAVWCDECEEWVMTSGEPEAACAAGIAASTRAEWRNEARPTNHDSARIAVLNRRIVQLLDALADAKVTA